MAHCQWQVTGPAPPKPFAKLRFGLGRNNTRTKAASRARQHVSCAALFPSHPIAERAAWRHANGAFNWEGRTYDVRGCATKAHTATRRVYGYFGWLQGARKSVGQDSVGMQENTNHRWRAPQWKAASLAGKSSPTSNPSPPAVAPQLRTRFVPWARRNPNVARWRGCARNWALSAGRSPCFAVLTDLGCRRPLHFASS